MAHTSEVALTLEHEGRERKVEAIVVGVAGAGYGAREAARFTDAQWKALTDSLGLRRPSPISKRMVVERLAGSVRERALCPTCALGDPEGEAGPRKPSGHPGRCTR